MAKAALHLGVKQMDCSRCGSDYERFEEIQGRIVDIGSICPSCQEQIDTGIPADEDY